MAFVSFAQNFEDVLLFRALHKVTQGNYVDIGANHPVEDSVTKAFYDRGWRGVNVEPVAYWLQKLQEDRPKDLNIQVAISNTDQPLEFFEISETGLSTLDTVRACQYREEGFTVTTTTVECWTLKRLFETIKQPVTHFLKIDVEGAEAQVIASGDWKTYRPWIVLIESTRPNTNESDHDAWEPILLEADYQFVWFDGINRYYLAYEHQHLAAAFKIPVNVLDGYISYREVALAESRYELILDMDWKQTDFQTELESAKEAINSAKMAHDNALASMEAQSAAFEAQTTLLAWYHSDPIIRTAIRFRKIPGFCKRHLRRHVHKISGSLIEHLDHFPRLKIQLSKSVAHCPWLVQLLRRLSGRPLPRLDSLSVLAEPHVSQRQDRMHFPDKINQEES